MTNVVAMAHRMMGTTDTAQHALRPELDTAIGGSEVRMIDHVEGYATLANGGWHIPLTGVLKVIDSQGHVVENYDPNAIAHQQVVSPQEAYLVTDVLRHYNQQWHLGFRLPFAAKSGTTNDFADAWLMAYSPQLVVGTWTGNTPHGGGREPTDGVFGSMTGIYVTAPFLNSTAVARLNITDFTKPDGLVSATVCGQSAPELYLPGTQPTTCGGPQPSVIPSGSPAPSPSPSPSPSEETSPLPPSPSVTVYLTPSAAPSSNTSPSPNASPSPRSSSPQPSSSP
jgi:membrane peptidoglycan carboxypeptidase